MTLQRENDEFIMDLIIITMSISDAQLRSFSYAQLHFKCYSFADVYSGDGISSRKSVLESTLVYETSNYEWPTTKPCKEDYIVLVCQWLYSPAIKQ